MKQPETKIGVASQDDLPGVLDLYMQLSPEDPRTEISQAVSAYNQLLACAGSGIYIARVDRAIVATCTLVVIPNLTRSARPYALIENVVVHRNHRRKGYGRKVLDAATRAAWDAGCYKLMLLTGVNEEATFRFYIAAGFEQTKTGFQKRQIAARATS
ncbi:MAG: GNAT family N-acetyltransferase [Hyphomicrobiales bacterium]